jgi:hypothetical protein
VGGKVWYGGLKELPGFNKDRMREPSAHDCSERRLGEWEMREEGREASGRWGVSGEGGVRGSVQSRAVCSRVCAYTHTHTHNRSA